MLFLLCHERVFSSYDLHVSVWRKCGPLIAHTQWPWYGNKRRVHIVVPAAPSETSLNKVSISRAPCLSFSCHCKSKQRKQLKVHGHHKLRQATEDRWKRAILSSRWLERTFSNSFYSSHNSSRQHTHGPAKVLSLAVCVRLVKSNHWQILRVLFEVLRNRKLTKSSVYSTLK